MKNKTVLRARSIFREKFYQNKYNGGLHALTSFILLTIFSILPWVFLKQMSSIALFTFLISYITCTLILYYQHRFPQHRPIKGFKFFFKIHRVHHSFFNYENMYVKDAHDNMFILFPISFILGYCLILFPVFLAPLYFVLGLDYFLIALSSACFYFLSHELIHYLSHTKKDHFIYNLPIVSFLCEHHRIHHASDGQEVMNFNMILPLGDYVFKTIKLSLKE